MNPNKITPRLYKYFYGEELPNDLCSYVKKSMIAWFFGIILVPLSMPGFLLARYAFGKEEYENREIDMMKNFAITIMLIFAILFLACAFGITIYSAMVLYEVNFDFSLIPESDFEAVLIGIILFLIIISAIITYVGITYFKPYLKGIKHKPNMMVEYFKGLKNKYCVKIEWDDKD